MGKSGHVGRKISSTLASTGTPSFFVHAGEASHGDLGMITADDVIMALSWSGETAELKNLIDYSRRFRTPLIAVTADANSTLGQAADVVLVLPQAREACPHNLAPTTSSLMQLALGDALAIALLESRGFTALDFGCCIPAAGSARCSSSRATSCTPATPCRSSRRHADVPGHRGNDGQGLGCVGIADREGQLLGIVTDGDLRRHMRPDLLDAVDDVMTPIRRPWRPISSSARCSSCSMRPRSRGVRRGGGQAGRHRAPARSLAHWRGLVRCRCGSRGASLPAGAAAGRLRRPRLPFHRAGLCECRNVAIFWRSKSNVAGRFRNNRAPGPPRAKRLPHVSAEWYNSCNSGVHAGWPRLGGIAAQTATATGVERRKITFRCDC